MSERRDGKHVTRAIRNIPVDQVGPEIIAEEGDDGRWCMVAGELTFVMANGRSTETTWDDPVKFALYIRYVQKRPERIHPNHESALAFARSQVGPG